MENVVLLSTTSEKSKIRKNEIQYFIVQHFPFFRQKLSVVLKCTPRSEKGRRAAAVEPPRARRYCLLWYSTVWVRGVDAVLVNKLV